MSDADLEIRLPWPSRKLGPNAREHWAAKAKAKKAYRHDAHTSHAQRCADDEVTPWPQ